MLMWRPPTLTTPRANPPSGGAILAMLKKPAA
nr:MAG TPA: hypothetical protein [Caudoviricetes sp.]